MAVIANNSWAALKARDLLEIEWESGPNADYESEAFKQLLLETVRQPGEAARDEGQRIIEDGLDEDNELVKSEGVYNGRLGLPTPNIDAIFGRTWFSPRPEDYGLMQGIVNSQVGLIQGLKI